MRKLSLLLLLLVLVLSVSLGQSYKYGYAGPFPDTAKFKLPGGVVNGGIAIDPAGKVWIQTYGGATDSFPSGYKTGAIYVFDKNGNQVSFSPILKLTGKTELGVTVTDTLDGSGYGLKVDPTDGNILSVKWSSRLWKIDYKTGNGIRRIQTPIVGTTSLAGAGVDQFGEIFLAPVLPGFPVIILNPDFTPAGNVTPVIGDYGRSIEVSADGNDVYTPRFGILKTYIFHSDNGSLGPYALKDSIFLGGSVESIAIHPKTKYVWASTDRRSTGPWTPNSYYAYDPVTKAVVDSFNVAVWDKSSTGPLPRGIAFSPTGDTVFVGHFDVATLPPVVMFIKNKTVNVDREEGQVPDGYTLSQNYPNPFNPSTQIRFTITETATTTLKVYDMMGREVATLVNEALAPGAYNVKFDAKSLSSGTYVYVLTSGGNRLMNKMLLLK